MSKRTKPKTDRRGRETMTAEHYTKTFRQTMVTEAWRSLSTTAQALYPWLKFEWHGPQRNNNGKIQLSVRQAADRLNVSTNTAARAFHDLQAKGFLVAREIACLGASGQGRTTEFEITEIAMPGAEKSSGRKLYLNWPPGNDFPIRKPNTNNPAGLNGKQIQNPIIKMMTPRHQNEDEEKSSVIKMKTGRHQNSDVQAVSGAPFVSKMKTSLYTIPIAMDGPPLLNVRAGIELCPQWPIRDRSGAAAMRERTA